MAFKTGVPWVRGKSSAPLVACASADAVSRAIWIKKPLDTLGGDLVSTMRAAEGRGGAYIGRRRCPCRRRNFEYAVARPAQPGRARPQLAHNPLSKPRSQRELGKGKG